MLETRPRAVLGVLLFVLACAFWVSRDQTRISLVRRVVFRERDATEGHFVEEFRNDLKQQDAVDTTWPWPWKPTPAPTAMDNSPIIGTPEDVPHSTDCKIRGSAYTFGRSLLPKRGTFKTLYDALVLQRCPGVVKDIPRTTDVWRPPSRSGLTEDPVGVSVLILFVDVSKGKDSHSGTKDKPLATIHEALARVIKSRATKSEVILREGTYYIPPSRPLFLIKGHSGLTIRNAPGERAIISGAERIRIPRNNWSLVSQDKEKDIVIWSTKLAAKTLPFDGLRLGTERLVRAKTPNGAPEQSQHVFMSSKTDQLFGNDAYYASGWFTGDSKEVTWVTPDQASLKESQLQNATVESVMSPAYEVYESSAKDWPSVTWPKHKDNSNIPAEKRPYAPINGAGGQGSYLIASNGACLGALKPAVGYFCSKNPPRGAENTFRFPRGVILKRKNGLELNKDALLVAWRGGEGGIAGGNPRWFTWTWRVSSWKAQFPDGLRIDFDPKVGGNQGAQGSDRGSYFYVENIKSGLDEAGEYFYDPERTELFVVFNSTRFQPTGLEDWGLVRSKELIRVVGTIKDPLTNINFVGIEFRDTALTWLEPHAVPSGGDWTLPRSAAIVTRNVDGFAIRDCYFERLDGSAILLDGFARNVIIERNEFAWLGASAVISWGRTSNCLNHLCTRKITLDDFEGGPDGRGGNQPRGTKVVGNLFRELGVFVKQSAAYFSALSGLATIEGNVMFNAPRSFINFNDGFLGGDVVRRNLLLNAVRESSDHGPINLWDRMPFFWEGQREGKSAPTPTVVPLYRTFERNFVLANHASQTALDSDDGASYIKSRFNVFAYGGIGLKSDFGGHHHESVGDLYIQVQAFCFMPIPKLSPPDSLQLVFKNNTCIIRGTNPFAYGSKCSSSKPGQNGEVEVGKNRVVGKSGPLKVCDGETLKQALSKHSDRDPGTVELKEFPSDEQTINWISEILS